MCRKTFLLSFLLLMVLAGSAPAAVSVDDFESYTDTAALRATWAYKGWSLGTFNRYLDDANGVGGSRAIRFDGSAGSGGFGGMYKRHISAADLSAADGYPSLAEDISRRCHDSK